VLGSPKPLDGFIGPLHVIEKGAKGKERREGREMGKRERREGSK